MSKFHLIDGGLRQPSGIDGGGGPPHDSDMERRVASLEANVESMRSTLENIRVQLAEMPKKSDIDTFRTEVNGMAVDVGVIKGRVSALPTLTGLSTLAGILTIVCSALVFLYHLAVKHNWF